MLTARKGFIALMLLLPITAFTADLETLKSDCDSCHGPLGVSAHPDVPIIAGQTAEFITRTLEGFQLWDRPCVKCDYKTGGKSGSRTDMCKIANTLSYEEIEALSDWYAGQTFVSASQEFDAAQVEAGKALHAKDCESCHVQGGSVADKGPRLAGQWKQYLASTVKYFPTGEHMCPPMMDRKIAGYSKEQISQLLNFYASQQE